MLSYRSKNVFSILIVFNLFSCQNINNTLPNFDQSNSNDSKKIISTLDNNLVSKSEILGKDISNPFDIDVTHDLSKKSNFKTGNSLLFKINNNYPKNSFSLKANAKSTNFMMINSYQVYLIKDASSVGYPAGGDPLNPSNLVAGPFIINLDSTKLNPYVRFSNIGTSSGNTFYIALRAFSGINLTGTELILPNNGSSSPWTGVTAVTPRVAVSDSGVSIDAATVPTPLTALNINANLDPINSGNDIKIYPKGDYEKISYFKVNLCTDPTMPISTKVLATPIQINKTYGVYDLSWLNRFYNMAKVWNIPLGKYYLTVEAYNSSNANLVTANNSGAPYSGSDSGSNTAVSTNNVTIFSDYFYDYNSADKSFFEVILNLINFPIIINNFAGSSAGTSGNTGDTGQATSATLNNPKGVWGDNSGNIYISDSTNNRIRKVASSGVITNFAGSSAGTPGNTGDNGQATNATLSNPKALWRDNAGNSYIADSTNNRIRKVSATGVITNFAGNSAASPGNTGDTGLATNATLSNPSGIWGDNAGNIYISDSGNNRIRKVSATGIITNFAGDSAGSPGNTGDNGQATSASLSNPIGIWGDNLGNIYISDSGNNRVRKVSANKVITNFSGSSAGAPGNTGDNGQATNATLSNPSGIWGDNASNIYISDSINNRIRKVDSNGIITNFVGNSSGSSGNTGDTGQATNATLSSPSGLWCDNASNIYIADSTNNRIRKIR